MIPTPQEINRLEDEIADNLYEIDDLNDRLRRSEEEYTELEEMYRRANEELREWINSSVEGSENYYDALNVLDDTQERANSWFEAAKYLSRQWTRSCEYAKQLVRDNRVVEAELNELKTALRVLGGGRSDREITQAVNLENMRNSRR